MSETRRNRTWQVWLLWVALAIGALAVAIASLALTDRWLRSIIRDEIEKSLPPETIEEPSGGAEVPVPEPAAETGWRFPIADEDFLRLTSPYGLRVSPLLDIEVFHTGLDIAAAWRAQTVAVAAGTVVENWPPPGTPYSGGGTFRGHPTYGGLVIIEHDDGMRTLYGHLSWVRVWTGKQVQAGEVIGRIGDTGRSDGEHLHFGVFGPDGTALNPLHYVPMPSLTDQEGSV